jgi:hypothetical protein
VTAAARYRLANRTLPESELDAITRLIDGDDP